MSFFDLLRRVFVGNEVELAHKAMADEAARREPTPDEAFILELERGHRDDCHELLVGFLPEHDYPVALAVDELVGVHRWSTGATGSGKSAQVLAEELQLIGPGMPWSLLHLDAKSESSPWLTDWFLPAICMACDTEAEVADLLGGLRVINPFDEKNLPPLNCILPVPGTPVALQAREVANLISEALGPGGDTWGPRMTNVLFYALRAVLEIGGLSLLEVRSLLVNDQYLNGLLPLMKDPDVKEYFVYRFPSENKESISAVVSRLDLLLLEDTARVLCAPECISFPNLLENPLTIIDVGASPNGAEFLTQWWLSVFVRGISRAIRARPKTNRPCFCVLDEWWMGLDDELSLHFERQLSLARSQKVGLWLVNQLPDQVGSRSPVLLATIKNNCGLQIAFRQSYEDARSMAYMLPVSDQVRVRRTPDHPKWDTRVARPEEQRRALTEELSRLPNRTFWLYPKKMGHQAVKLVAPEVPFRDAWEAADKAPAWLRAACRGHGAGYSRQDLDAVLAKRRAQIAAIAAGRSSRPRDDLGGDRGPPDIAGSPPGGPPSRPKKVKLRPRAGVREPGGAGAPAGAPGANGNGHPPAANPCGDVGAGSSGGTGASPPPSPGGRGNRGNRSKEPKFE